MRILFVMLFGLCSVALADERPMPSITIEHEACYGTCPIYSMTFFADGTYFWVGKDHVKVKGRSYGKASAAVYDRAMKTLAEAQYMKFADHYYSKEDGCKEFWTDNPTVTITVQSSSSTKNIVHYYGCRGFNQEAELEKLELQIDELLETSKWMSGH